MKKGLIVSIFLLAFALSSTAFAFWNSEPSDEDIQILITSRLSSNGLPPEWSAHSFKNKLKVLNFINIERGRYNKQKNYWPVTAHLSGEALIRVINNREEKISFEGTAVFHIYKSDFASKKWEIILHSVQN